MCVELHRWNNSKYCHRVILLCLSEQCSKCGVANKYRSTSRCKGKTGCLRNTRRLVTSVESELGENGTHYNCVILQVGGKYPSCQLRPIFVYRNIEKLIDSNLSKQVCHLEVPESFAVHQFQDLTFHGPFYSQLEIREVFSNDGLVLTVTIPTNVQYVGF